MTTYDEFLSRHKPQSFSDLTFANLLVQQQLAGYAMRKNYGHILLHGPFGSAKTTTAIVIIGDRQKLSGFSTPHIERYAAGDLRGKLFRIEKSLNLLLMLQGREDIHPYILIDELDQLPKRDQADLRALMDEMPVGKLLMTTNDIKQIDGGVVSRADVFEMMLPTAEQLLPRAKSILAAETLKDTDAALINVMTQSSLRGGNPDIRDVMRSLYRRLEHLKALSSQPSPAPISSITPTPTAAVSSSNTATGAPMAEIIPINRASLPIPNDASNADPTIK